MNPVVATSETVMLRKFRDLTDRVGCAVQTCALLCGLLFGAAPALAQSSPSKSPQSQTRMDAAAREMGGHARLNDVPRQRKDMADFVVGNMLFVLLHEMAHVHVTEMGLPVLGREEDAADAFATLAMLRMGSEFSHGVLVQAAKGWFLSAERDERMGSGLTFYDEHGLDQQRAYQIVCLMVGSDPDQFKVLADWVRMPEQRQESCQGDYSNASYSWDKVLKPHRRGADDAKITIRTMYGEATGSLDVTAQSFRAIRLLEAVAERASEEYTWRAPFTLAMQSCGQSGAQWDLFSRKLTLCYEMADEFVQLYGTDTADRKPAGRLAPSDLISRNIRALPAQHGVAAAGSAADAKLTAATERPAEDPSAARLEQLAQALHTESIEFVAQPVKNKLAASTHGVLHARR
jgi:hypothetical protein